MSADTYGDLRRTIATYGRESDQARRAAIALCLERGLDPHFRYPVYKRLSSKPSDKPMEPQSIAAVEEWQRLLAQVAA